MSLAHYSLRSTHGAIAGEADHIPGQVMIEKDIPPSTEGGGYLGTNHTIFFRMVRNQTGAALPPGAVVDWKLTETSLRDRVKNIGAKHSNTAVFGALAGVVSPWLPASVADGDIFPLIIKGPTKILSPTGGHPTAAIAVGDLVGTETATGAYNSFVPGTTDTDALTEDLPQLKNIIGWAMAAHAASSDEKTMLEIYFAPYYERTSLC